jgi:hypothetical protein
LTWYDDFNILVAKVVFSPINFANKYQLCTISFGNIGDWRLATGDWRLATGLTASALNL